MKAMGKSKNMNLQEIKERYGEVKLKFQSYYKYSFDFIGTTDKGEEITVAVGGNADDIYKLSVGASKEETINSLDPHFIQVVKDGETIVDWYHY